MGAIWHPTAHHRNYNTTTQDTGWSHKVQPLEYNSGMTWVEEQITFLQRRRKASVVGLSAGLMCQLCGLFVFINGGSVLAAYGLFLIVFNGAAIGFHWSELVRVRRVLQILQMLRSERALWEQL